MQHIHVTLNFSTPYTTRRLF